MAIVHLALQKKPRKNLLAGGNFNNVLLDFVENGALTMDANCHFLAFLKKLYFPEVLAILLCVVKN